MRIIISDIDGNVVEDLWTPSDAKQIREVLESKLTIFDDHIGYREFLDEFPEEESDED